MRRCLLIIAALFTVGRSPALFAQCGMPGKDGNATGVSTNVNTYYNQLNGTISGSVLTLGTVNPAGANTPVTAGDLLLII